MDRSDTFIDRFGEVAKQAVVYELRLRLLAASHPAIADKALVQQLAETEEAIFAHFAADIQPSEVTNLRASRRVRNKFLHADFAEAANLLRQELGRTVASGGVFMASLETGEVTEVNASTTSEGTLFGWLLNGYNGGLFEQAELAFLDAIRVVTRLRDVAIQRSLAKK